LGKAAVPVIHIVSYGLGNVQAFANIYTRLGISAKLVTTAEELEDAQGIILPGVGAFDHAVTLLDQSGMRATLEHCARVKGVPVLGICVGMQILATGSEEGSLSGLGWVPGHVRSFSSNAQAAALPLPHMGWNDVRPTQASPLLVGLEDDARFYFLHSYYFETAAGGDTLATAHYGLDFSCVVNAGNVYGVQCHPEKSHHWGAQLLRNFAGIAGC
jgi:imidazole glycerol-phosphate synthase subunit HisH